MTDAIGAAETTQCGLAAGRRTGAIDRQSCGKTNPQRDAGGQPLPGPGDPDTDPGNALAPIRGGGVTPWFIRARPAAAASLGCATAAGISSGAFKNPSRCRCPGSSKTACWEQAPGPEQEPGPASAQP